MSLFKKNKKYIKKEIDRLFSEESSKLKEGLEILKDESFDFSSLMELWSVYQELLNQFLQNPTQELFKKTENQLNAVKEDFEKINKKTHTIEDMISWMEKVLERDANFLKRVYVKSVDVR